MDGKNALIDALLRAGSELLKDIAEQRRVKPTKVRKIRKRPKP